MITVKNKDIISIGNKRYQMGSVASYALEYNECPIEQFNKAQEYGYDLWWANSIPAMLTSEGEKPDYGTPVAIGDELYFEGHTFTIAKAPNGNIKLVKHD